jgi:hypothetical protein
VWAPDDDGTRKARIFEDGQNAIVGGSRVERRDYDGELFDQPAGRPGCDARCCSR